MTICVECGAEFEVSASARTKSCSVACRGARARANQRRCYRDNPGLKERRRERGRRYRATSEGKERENEQRRRRYWANPDERERRLRENRLRLETMRAQARAIRDLLATGGESARCEQPRGLRQRSHEARGKRRESDRRRWQKPEVKERRREYQRLYRQKPGMGRKKAGYALRYWTRIRAQAHVARGLLAEQST